MKPRAVWKCEGAYVCQVPPKLEDAFVKELTPENVLLLARSVEDAAVIVPVPPREITVPFTVREELASDAFGIALVLSVLPDQERPVPAVI